MVQVVQTIYMSANALTLVQIGFAYSVYQFSKIVFEVPTGFIADKFGRINSTILGLVCLIISLLIVIVDTSFLSFTISMLVQGLSYTFISGASDALLIDSIYAANEHESFEKVNAVARFLSYAAVFASAALGGLIAKQSLIYVYIATVLTQGIPLIILVFFVKEPPYKDKNLDGIRVKKIMQYVHSRRIILWLMSIDVIISIALIPIEAHYFNYLKTLGIGEDISGIIYGIQYVAASLLSLILYKPLSKIMGRKTIVILPPIMMLFVFGFGYAESVVAKAAFYFAAMLMLCCFAPMKNMQLHSRIESTYRASILSLQSICMSLSALITHPLFAYVAENKGYSIAVEILSGIASLLMVIACAIINKLLKSEKIQCEEPTYRSK